MEKATYSIAIVKVDVYLYGTGITPHSKLMVCSVQILPSIVLYGTHCLHNNYTIAMS